MAASAVLLRYLPVATCLGAALFQACSAPPPEGSPAAVQVTASGGAHAGQADAGPVQVEVDAPPATAAQEDSTAAPEVAALPDADDADAGADDADVDAGGPAGTDLAGVPDAAEPDAASPPDESAATDAASPPDAEPAPAVIAADVAIQADESAPVDTAVVDPAVAADAKAQVDVPAPVVDVSAAVVDASAPVIDVPAAVADAAAPADVAKADAPAPLDVAAQAAADAPADAANQNPPPPPPPPPAPALVSKRFQAAFGGAGSENFYGVKRTPDGGYIGAGHTDSWGAGGQDLLMVKFDACGAAQWARAFGGKKDDYAWAVTIAKDGGYIAAGGSNTWPGTYVVKTDAQGNLLWSHSYGGSGYDFAFGITALADGGVVLVIEQYSYAFKPEKAHALTLMKLDAQGAVVWAHSYGGKGDGDAGYQLVELENGDLALGGGAESFGPGNDDFWLLVTDSLGVQKWSMFYGTSGDEEPRDMIRTSDGGFLMTGHTTGWGAKGKDVGLIKLGADGSYQWMKRFGGAGLERGQKVLEVADGYVVVGFTQSFQGGAQSDVFWAKTDKAGVLKTFRVFGNNASQYGWFADADGTGGFTIAGQAFGFGKGKSDALLMRLDKDGHAAGCDEVDIPLASVSQGTCTAPKVGKFMAMQFGGGKLWPTTTVVTPIAIEGAGTAICPCQ